MPSLLSPLDLFMAGVRSMLDPPPPRQRSRVATYGVLTAEQKSQLVPFIRGRRLRDYGCGNLELDIELLGLGARHIEAIDELFMPVPKKYEKRLRFIQSSFDDCAPSERTVVLSWPYNRATGVVSLLWSAPRVIYLGNNTGGTACGYPSLWRELLRRKVELYAPDRHNTLIVYGEGVPTRKRLMPEEAAALKADDYVSFDRAHSKKTWPLPGRRGSLT